MNIPTMLFIIIPIANAMIRETALPNLRARSHFFLIAKRISALDKLHGLLQGRLRLQDQMNMIRHDNKFVKPEFFVIAIAKQNLKKQLSRPFGAKEHSPTRCNGRHEEYAFRKIHCHSG